MTFHPKTFGKYNYLVQEVKKSHHLQTSYMKLNGFFARLAWVPIYISRLPISDTSKSLKAIISDKYFSNTPFACISVGGKLTAYGVIMMALNIRFVTNIYTLTMQANEKKSVVN
jgi:hypothetical protein